MTHKLTCPDCFGKGYLSSEPEDFSSYIYFVYAPRAQRIKIGITKDVPKRIRQLQTGSSEPLEVIVVVRGSRDHEKAWHICFASLRQHGEWFTAHPYLLRLIKSFTTLEKISLSKIRRSGDELSGKGNP
jgi:hypothetical protein